MINRFNMYQITLTRFLLHDGTEERDTKPVVVKDLEAHRQKLYNPKYKSINFVYQEIHDSGKDNED